MDIRVFFGEDPDRNRTADPTSARGQAPRRAFVLETSFFSFPCVFRHGRSIRTYLEVTRLSIDPMHPLHVKQSQLGAPLVPSELSWSGQIHWQMIEAYATEQQQPCGKGLSLRENEGVGRALGDISLQLIIFLFQPISCCLRSREGQM